MADAAPAGVPRIGSAPELAAAAPSLQLPLPPLELPAAPAPAAAQLHGWQAQPPIPAAEPCMLQPAPADRALGAQQDCSLQLPIVSGACGDSAGSGPPARGEPPLPEQQAAEQAAAGAAVGDGELFDSGTLGADTWDWLLEDTGERRARQEGFGRQAMSLNAMASAAVAAAPCWRAGMVAACAAVVSPRRPG